MKIATPQHCSASVFGRRSRNVEVMYSGTLINDLFAVVERAYAERAYAERPQIEQTQVVRAHGDSRTPHAEPVACQCAGKSLEPEKFPQPSGLSPADWNLCLFLVVHAQLVRALEPRNDFADAVDVHQVGAVGSPKQIRI
jgi:hypothetical protein